MRLNLHQLILIFPILCFIHVSFAASVKKNLTTVKNKKRNTKKEHNLLHDTTNRTNDVPVEANKDSASDLVQVQLTPKINEQFMILLRQGNYEKAGKLFDKMGEDERVQQLCSPGITVEHFKGLFGLSTNRKIPTSFFVWGEITLVREAIIGLGVFSFAAILYSYDMAQAIVLSLKEGKDERVFEILEAMKTDDMTVKEKYGRTFENFITSYLFAHIAPEKDNASSIKRLLTLQREAFIQKYPEMFQLFCRKFMCHLKWKLFSPEFETIMVDLIAQPSLLTSTMFIEEFLECGYDDLQFHFNKFGWREAIQEALEGRHKYGGEYLWKGLLGTDDQFAKLPKEFPPSPETLAMFLNQFQTKKELEEEWIEKRAPGYVSALMKQFGELASDNILLTVLWNIIIEYAKPTWLDI